MYIHPFTNDRGLRPVNSTKSENDLGGLCRDACGLLASSLQTLHDEFTIEIAESAELIEQAHRLRYQTYCIERGYEASATGLEVDEFDARSRHAIMRHRGSGHVVGTVRLVLACPVSPENSLPVHRLCPLGTLPPLPIRTTAEISRFALSKRLRGMTGAPATLMRLGLMRGIVQMSHELGLTHWCAVMERSLLRLLQSTAIHFNPAGPPVEHHGVRQPSYGHINAILGRMREEQMAVWDFITGSGAFWHLPDELCLPGKIS